MYLCSSPSQRVLNVCKSRQLCFGDTEQTGVTLPYTWNGFLVDQSVLLVRYAKPKLSNFGRHLKRCREQIYLLRNQDKRSVFAMRSTCMSSSLPVCSSIWIDNAGYRSNGSPVTHPSDSQATTSCDKETT